MAITNLTSDLCVLKSHRRFAANWRPKRRSSPVGAAVIAVTVSMTAKPISFMPDRSKQDQRLHTSFCTHTTDLAGQGRPGLYPQSSSMDAGAVIFGKVNKHNYKAKRAGTSLLPVSSANLIIEGESSRIRARTDEQGGYRITGLAPGAYTVKIKVPNGMIGDGVRAGEWSKGRLM